MSNEQDLYQLFIEELEEMYSSERQIVKSLPNLINLASNTNLKEALSNHLEETKNHVTRLIQLFSLLSETPNDIACNATQGLLKEAEQLVKTKIKSPLLDAAIISAVQKIEHYEIASYGTLHSFARILNLNGDIIDLILETLDEEEAIDKKLTRIADGSLFSKGINQEAVGPAGAHGHARF